MSKTNEFIVNSLKTIDVTEDSLFDIIYNLYVKISIARGLDDIENERVMTIEESMERIRKKYENTNF